MHPIKVPIPLLSISSNSKSPLLSTSYKISIIRDNDNPYNKLLNTTNFSITMPHIIPTGRNIKIFTDI